MPESLIPRKRASISLFFGVVTLNFLLLFPVLFQTYKHYGDTLTPMDVEGHLLLVDEGPRAVDPPFRYRVLAPLVVQAMRVLPGYDIPIDFSGTGQAKADFFHFLLLNGVLTLLASGILFLYLARYVSFGPAYVGSLLYLFSFYTATANFIPMSDAACHLAIITAIWFFERNNLWAFALACLIGVFAKETVLVVLVPWILVHSWRDRTRLVYLLALLPALIGYLTFTRLLPGDIEYDYYRPGFLLSNLLQPFHPSTYTRTFLFHLILGFLPVVAAVAGFAWLRWKRGVRLPLNAGLVVFVFLLWLGIVMGIDNNAMRVAFMAFPAVTLFQARVVQAMFQDLVQDGNPSKTS